MGKVERVLLIALIGFAFLGVSVEAAPIVKRQNVTTSQNTTLPFTRLVIFGDSYSDSGYPYGSIAVSNGTWPADPAYYQGHFSNGPVWPQMLSQTLNVSSLSYAVGGATADNNLVQGYTGYSSNISVPGVVQQVESYLNSSNSSSASASLHFILVGLNDILFNSSLAFEPQLVVERIQSSVSSLQAAGATQFVLGVEPSLGALPYTWLPNTNSTPANFTAYDSYTSYFKGNLSSFAATLRAPTQAAVVDLGPLWESVESNGTAYGLNSSYTYPPTACLRGSYPNDGPRTLCSDPSSHLFFDTYHPTTQGHELVTQAFLGEIWNTFALR